MKMTFLFLFLSFSCFCVWFQVRKLKGSDEHLSVDRSTGAQDLLVSPHKPP